MARGTAVRTGRRIVLRGKDHRSSCCQKWWIVAGPGQPQALLGAGLRMLRIFAAGIRLTMIGIMVRRFVVRTSVTNPKFAIPGGSSASEFRIQSHTSNLLNLVWFRI